MAAKHPLLAVVLDNEALQALADPRHRKHRLMLAKLAAVKHQSSLGAAVRVVTPTAVRVEAQVSRQAAGTATVGRFNVQDVPLDSARADRCVTLASVARGTAVDATVAEAAEAEAQTRLVTVYTADVQDISRLVTHTANASRTAVRLV